MSSSTKPPQAKLTSTISNQQQLEHSSDRMFRVLAHLFKNHPMSKLIVKSQKIISNIKSNQNTIKPKMFAKLVNWMEKLCFQTLQFSESTYENSIKILKNYLQISSQSPSSLQMLGCIVLHISSKLHQKNIVSIESYRECCMNIFSKQEFQQKECQVYQKLNSQITYNSVFQILEFLNYGLTDSQILSDNQKNKISIILKQYLKQIQFLELPPIDIVSNIFIQVQANPQVEIKKQQIFALVKLRKIQY